MTNAVRTALCFLSIALCAIAGGNNYRNFDVALYSRV
jgi:hypothetical protein